MVKIIVKHEVADSDKEHWIAEFERKKVIRETYGISQGTEPAMYTDELGEIVVVHQIRDTVRDALKAMDHIQTNATSRKRAGAKGKPVFSE
jgi:hypothetical protein